MGNRNSGWRRENKKRTVESCYSLDIRLFTSAIHSLVKQNGKDYSVSLDWQDGFRVFASILPVNGWTLAGPYYLSIDYAYGDRQIHQKISLAENLQRFGGYDFLFLCPECSKRVCKLHFAESGNFSGFGCRHCHHLTYTSTQTSHPEREAFLRKRGKKTDLRIRNRA